MSRHQKSMDVDTIAAYGIAGSSLLILWAIWRYIPYLFAGYFMINGMWGWFAITAVVIFLYALAKEIKIQNDEKKP